MNSAAYADLSSHDTFAQGTPHETFARIRAEDPVHWTEETDGSGKGFWSITRHGDIVKANMNFKTFSSSRGIRIEEMDEEELEARKTLMEMDPPEHTNLRRMVAHAFQKKVVAQYEQQVRDIAISVIDQAITETEFDAVEQIARKVPMLMLGRLLGVPDSDAEWLVTKGDEMIANSDPDYTDHVVDQVNTDEFRLYPFRSPAGKEMFDYSEKLATIKRQKPGNDISSMLLGETAEGELLSDHEFKNMFTLAAAAGNDTTRYSISSTLHALANQPELIDQLNNADATGWDTAIEEFMRWGSATMHFRRTAMEDFELADKQIKKGDKVLLWFVSGNRDESVFDQPFTIDLTRKPNPHMAFGRGGPHACLGQWLARMELKLVLEELLKRVKSFNQTGTERYLRSNFIRGIKYLPISIQLH